MGRHVKGSWCVGRVDDEPDQVAVDLCLAGDFAAHRLTTAERKQVVAILAGRGMSDPAIAQRTHWASGRAVERFRRYHRIPAGVASPGGADNTDKRAGWWRDPVTRELQVRQMAGLGLVDREIGRRAGVCGKTVWSYRHTRDIPAGRPRR